MKPALSLELHRHFDILRESEKHFWCVSEHLCLQNSHCIDTASRSKPHQFTRYDATSLKMCMYLLEVTA